MRVIRRSIVVVATVLVGFLGAVLAFPAAAEASVAKAGPIVVSPAAIRPLFAAASSPPVSGVTASYSCDFANYENTAHPTIPPVTGVNFDYLVQTSWPVSVAQDVPLANEAAIPLPTAVSSQLVGLDDFKITASAATQGASSTTIAFEGDAPVPSSSVAPAGIPKVVADGQVTFPSKGTSGVELPAQTITITPIFGSTTSSPTPKPAITCTTTQAAADVPVTVGDAAGPFYTCATTIGSVTSTDSGTFDLALTASGTKQAGKTVTVKLTSDPVAALIVGLTLLSRQAGVQPTKATFTSSLAVAGAQTGTLTLPATVTNLSATSFSASGSLPLTTAGTVTVDIPGSWDLSLFKNTTKVVDIACTLVTNPPPVGLTMTVTAAPSASPSASDNGGQGADNTASPAASGEPSGGAATGGGPGPGSDVPLAMGGVALFLTGGGLVLRSVAAKGRRRPRSGER